MKVFVSRVSTEEQSELRQIQNVGGFDKVIIDKCDGDIGLWNRPEIVKNKIKKLVDNGTIKHIEFHQIDRMGRNLKNILEEYEYFTSKGIRVVCRNPNFQNFTESGDEDMFSKLLLSILGSVGAYEKSLIKKRQMEGIRITQKISPEKYSGRKQNTKESTLSFLTKHSKAVEYLEKGMKGVEVSKLCDISLNTITKIKKNLQPQQKVA
jgi:DNA invertase Pin-like site-specific DNA recombinase|tara:strand:- start:203 stop:826 length:624 start_codon:yes stop_codon:yes gene_type:complete